MLKQVQHDGGAELPLNALSPSVVDCGPKSSPQKGGVSFGKPRSELAYSTPAKAPAAKAAKAASTSARFSSRPWPVPSTLVMRAPNSCA
jgi:hypothetical protein